MDRELSRWRPWHLLCLLMLVALAHFSYYLAQFLTEEDRISTLKHALWYGDPVQPGNDTRAKLPAEHRNATEEAPFSCKPPMSTSYPLSTPEVGATDEIKKYVAWHKTARACLMDANCTKKPKVSIITCPPKYTCSGLGDRMRGLSFAVLLSMATHRAIFIHEEEEPWLLAGFVPAAIDWTLPSTVSLTNDTPYTKWVGCKASSSCSMEYLRNFAAHGVIGTVNFFKDDLEAVFSAHAVIAMTVRFPASWAEYLSHNPFFKDRFGMIANSSSISDLTGEVLRAFFRPSPETMRRMEQLSLSEEGSYVGVHIRTGRDLREASAPRFREISRNESEIVRDMLDCIEQKKYPRKVFLASDSAESKSLLMKEAKARGIEVKLFKEKAIHYAKTEKDSSSAFCMGFLTVFADLTLLSRAKVIIGTSGGFSPLARWLGRPGLILTYPGKCLAERI